MAQDENELKTDTGKAGSAKNPLLTVLVLLNTIMMGAIAYFQYQSFQRLSVQESVSDIARATNANNQVPNEDDFLPGEARQVEGFTVPLEPFTANLAQGDGPRRFVRLNLVLNFAKDSKQDEINARQPQIRDTVIRVLNSKRAEDLLLSEGKEFLKQELRTAINTFMTNGSVLDIYYVSFQIN